MGEWGVAGTRWGCLVVAGSHLTLYSRMWMLWYEGYLPCLGRKEETREEIQGGNS